MTGAFNNYLFQIAMQGAAEKCVLGANKRNNTQPLTVTLFLGNQ